MADLAVLEQALGAAVSASLRCPHVDRREFISRHLQAKLDGAALPIAEGGPQQDADALHTELAMLAEWLTGVVNGAREPLGAVPLGAVAKAITASLVDSTIPDVAVGGGLTVLAADDAYLEAMDEADKKTYAIKLEAQAAALEVVKIALTHLPPKAELTALNITRPMESTWGDREIALLADALERPTIDEHRLLFLCTRQRLDDAKIAEHSRALDRHLRTLGITVDDFGLWREDDRGEVRLGCMGSVLLVGDPEKVRTLNINCREVRGGPTLGSLLARMPHLIELRLSGSPFLVALPEEISKLAATLELLDLSGSTRLPALPEALGELASLRVLDLSGCDSLATLPSTVGNLSALQSLSISQSERDTAGAAEKEKQKEDEQVGPNRRKTAQATIEGQGIMSLPESLCALGALRHLALGLPGVQALPDNLGSLGRLQTLCLNGCSKLAALPASTSQLASLDYLELPSCPATIGLPDDAFTGLLALNTLDLFGCASLARVPLSIGSLASTLQALYIGSLDLASLPETLCDLASLRHLDLRLPSLVALPDALGSLMSLTSLYLTLCMCLPALPDSTGSLLKLRALRISRCSLLAELPASTSKLEGLAYLELTDCALIKSLPEGFGALPSLMGLDFDSCEALADVLYDDPVVDEMEARGIGMFGPGIEIETRKYVDIKAEIARDDEERRERLTVLRAEAAAKRES